MSYLTACTLDRVGTSSLPASSADIGDMKKDPSASKGDPKSAFATAADLQSKRKGTSTYSPTKNAGRHDA